MADPTPTPSRRFSEKEVALIIKRASEMQQEEAPAESANGMSLAELEQVAREAGLDPTLVRRAATDLDTRVTDQSPSRLVGAPTVLRLERTIDGEVPMDEYEPIVLEIQRMLDTVGSAATLGRSLNWMMSSSSARRHSTRAVQVIITPRNGRTTIRIEESLTGLAGGLFGGLLGGLGGGLSVPAFAVGIGAMHSGPAAIGLVGTLLSGSYLLARTIFGSVSRKRGDGLQALMSRLADHVSATAVSTPSLERRADPPSLEQGR